MAHFLNMHERRDVWMIDNTNSNHQNFASCQRTHRDKLLCLSFLE